MKKLIIPALIAISVLFITGCPGHVIDGRPPEYSVSNPSMIPDGSGGFIVAYQVNRGDTGSTYLQRLGANGDALWDENGLEIAGSWGFLGSDTECTSLVSDGKGNIIAVYPLKDGLRARKLDLEGNSVWPDEIRVSGEMASPGSFRAVSDGSGGAVTAWSASQDSIELQRMDSEGSLLWNTTILAEVDKFDIAGDASGSTFVIWKDNPSYSEGDVFVQRVDANGQIAWPTGGLRLTDEQNPGYVGGSFGHRIISDGSGGALCTWLQAVLSEDGRKIMGFNLYSQRISSEGKMLWEPGDMLITSMERAQEPRIVGSNPDSTLVFWEDMHNIYVQKLDSAGNTSWSEDGLEIVHTGDITYYSVTGDGAGGAVVVWNCSEGGNRYLYVQRMDIEGTLLWGDDGIKVSSTPPYWAEYSVPARISPDGTGGFAIAWASGSNIKDRDIIILR